MEDIKERMECCHYWFTNEEGVNLWSDFVGDEKTALELAEKYAKENECVVYVNSGEDIVDVIFY